MLGRSSRLMAVAAMAAVAGLASVPSRKIVTSGGLRLLDRQLTIAAQWASYAANTNLPSGYLPATSYDLVNLNVAYRPTADVTLTTSREPRTAMGGGVRLVVTLTVVVDEPDEAIGEAPTWPSGDFAIWDDRSKP